LEENLLTLIFSSLIGLGILAFLLGVFKYIIFLRVTSLLDYDRLPHFFEDIENGPHLSNYHPSSFKKKSYDQLTKYYLLMGLNPLQVGYFSKFWLCHPTEMDLKNLQLKKGMSVLDLGCGTCLPALYLEKKKKVDIVSVTNSSTQYDLALKHLKRARSNIKVLLEDFDKSEFEENSFDRILFLESIGYSQNIKSLLERCHKWLRPGGCLYIKSPTFSFPYEFTKEKKEVSSYWQYNHSTYENIIWNLKKSGFGKVKYRNIPVIWSGNLLRIQCLYFLILRLSYYKNKFGPRSYSLILSYKDN
jgi:SAM-dependent methyltransferase